ncbi:hypothetical protein B296_00009407 [Ensete ventricosum]|uniref:Uncharacterized protein n=1 Tax=Ensete ventricosum TaxID=4639 RepID=A0A426ZNH7_ENSVE|nr:hypothetical protein B296_00009407 [Ensete ventricosum]
MDDKIRVGSASGSGYARYVARDPFRSLARVLRVVAEAAATARRRKSGGLPSVVVRSSLCRRSSKTASDRPSFDQSLSSRRCDLMELHRIEGA